MKFTILSFWLWLSMDSLLLPFKLSAQTVSPCPQDYNRLIQLAQKEGEREKYAAAISLLNDAETCDPSKENEVDTKLVQLASKWENTQRRAINMATNAINALNKEKEKIIQQKEAAERSSFEARKRELEALERIEAEKKQRIAAIYQKNKADSLSSFALQQQMNIEKRYLNTQADLLLEQGDLVKAFRISEYARKNDSLIKNNFLLNKIYYHQPFQIDSQKFAAPFYGIVNNFDESIRDIQFSPDNTQLLLTFEKQSNLLILEEPGHEQIFVKGHSAPIVAAQYSPDGEYIFTASMDSTIKIWNRDALFLSNFKGLSGNLRDLQISENGRYVLTGAYGEAKIWDDDGNLLLVLPVPNQQITKVSWSRNQKYILLHYGNTIEVLQRKGNNLKYKSIFSKTFSTNFHSLQFSKDDQYILAAADDGTSRIWQINGRELKEKMVLKEHQSAVNTAYFSSNYKFIITASDDFSTKIWKWDEVKGVATEIEGLLLKEQNSAIRSARFSANEKQIMTVSAEGSLKFWNWKAKPIPFFEGTFHCPAISPADYLFADIAKDQIEVRNFNNETQSIWTHQQTGILHLDFSEDGKYLLSTGTDSTLKVWDWKEQVLMDSLKINSSQLFAEFSPTNSQLIAIGSSDGCVRFYDWEKKKLVKELKAHQAPINSIHFSNDGQFLASAADDKMATIWNTQTAEKVMMLQGHTSPVIHARFSPNGNYLVTASNDKAGKIWQTNGNQVIRLDYKGHTLGLSDACFLGNNDQILTTSMDGLAKIWDKSGKLLQDITKHHSIIAAMPSYDLQYLLIFTSQGVFIEYVDSEKLIEKVNQLGVPELTEADKEWFDLK
ncbi:MAG: hypothetical protein R3E32_02240 [Chitinophagales bacterium]